MGRVTAMLVISRAKKKKKRKKNTLANTRFRFRENRFGKFARATSFPLRDRVCKPVHCNSLSLFL